MTTDDIEAGVRDALARRAGEVPAHAADRLKQLDYRPRTRRGQPAITVGLATAVLAAGGGYVASLAGGTVSASRTPVSLAAFTLPAGYTAITTRCAPLPAGAGPSLTGHGEAGFAAGASAHGGCVEAALLAQAVPPPNTATPAPVGRYQGFLETRAADHTTTLYVEIPAAKGPRELIVVARHLSSIQVIDIARRTLGTP